MISEAWDARDRGVIFDIGHGLGSFSYDIGRAAMEDGFPPRYHQQRYPFVQYRWPRVRLTDDDVQVSEFGHVACGSDSTLDH